MTVSLDELEAAYRRVSRALYRAQEDALDFAAEEILAALERQQTIVDAAFFILIFGQIEGRINGLAATRLHRSEQRTALRGQAFGRRVRLALPGRQQEAVRTELIAWYGRRNDIAHGEVAVVEFDISQIFRRARELDVLLTQV